MKKLKAPEVVKMYFESLGNIGFSFEQVRDACNFSFKFVKLHFKDGNLPRIRLKYFGVFSVEKERALWGRYFNQELYDNKKIEEEVYTKRKQMLDKYFERYEKTKRKSSIKSRNQ